MQYRPQGYFFTPAATLVLALGLACAAPAGAQEQASWAVSGFGTFGVVHSSDRTADFTSSVLRHSGAGASHPWSADVDTNLGMQLDAKLDRRWSGVLQVVSEQRIDNSYRPKLEWANIKYQATPDLALRAGRIALPMFLNADYRKIGYIYPWVRPPVETYGPIPFTSSNGVDATLRWNLGRLRNVSQVFVGRDDLPLGGPYHARARNILGLSTASDWGALNLRVNLIRANATIDIADQLLDAFKAAGPDGAAIAQRYAVDGKPVYFANLGMSYDPGRWFMMAEASTTHSATFLGATRNMYVSAGWRWNAFTPYVTHAEVRAAGPTSDPGLPPPPPPPGPPGGPPPGPPPGGPPPGVPVAMMNAGLNELLAAIPRQRSNSIGLRWDCATNVALKLQYDRIVPGDGSHGSLINPMPDFHPDRMVHVASIAVSFVY